MHEQSLRDMIEYIGKYLMAEVVSNDTSKEG